MPPRNKDPKKPKGRTSAYAFFVQDRREMHKEKGEKIQFAKFSKDCSELWKNMTDEEKSKYARQAKEDKDRYTHEMANYQPPSDEEGAPAKGGKKKKDKNQPKRAMSAFLLFCGDKRPKLKQANPSASVGDLAKLLGAEWKTMTPAQKAPYEEKALKDKERYKAQMEAYKKPKPQQRKNKHEEDEDEEEEEEEDVEEEEEEDDAEEDDDD